MRYRDDILIAHSGTALQRAKFIRVLRIKSEIWTIKVESVRSDGIPLLDVWLHRGNFFHKTGILETGIYRKPSALKRPLGLTSMHPTGIHVCWPKALLARAQAFCSNRTLRQNEFGTLHEFFAGSFGTEYAEEVFFAKRCKDTFYTDRHAELSRGSLVQNLAFWQHGGNTS